jgi:hypothetical protein
MALLVSGAISFGSVGAAFAAQGDPATPVQTVPQQGARNSLPLAPGGAAGIKQAQGAGSSDWLLIGGSILIGVGILVLVSGGADNDSSPPTSGTN